MLSVKILVFTPVYRLERETANWLLMLHGNTKHDTDIVLSYIEDRNQNEFQRVCAQYQKARRMALDGGYDALLTVESDIIPPPDALNRLASDLTHYDIMLGVYAFRRGKSQEHLCDAAWNGKGYLGDFISAVDPRESHKRILSGGTYRASGLGLGCTLIKSSVLEMIDFRILDIHHCDIPFFVDSIKQGCIIGVCYSVLCGHKTPQGQILWPLEQIEKRHEIAERLYWGRDARKIYGRY